MRRKRHEPIPQEGLDVPFGPPPEESLYRCTVCGEELLVNEAIIDVAIGMAKFRGEYQGGMPTIGCPGCNGETLTYVGSCPCSLRLIQQPDKPGTMPSVQHVYEGVLPWSRICSSTSSR